LCSLPIEQVGSREVSDSQRRTCSQADYLLIIMKSDTKRLINDILKKVRDDQTKQLIFHDADQVIDAAVQFLYLELKKKKRLN
jgi:hypothetical protein